jgi:hypothetical protein
MKMKLSYLTSICFIRVFVVLCFALLPVLWGLGHFSSASKLALPVVLLDIPEKMGRGISLL